MKLSQLCDGVECAVYGNSDTQITGLCYDSRKTKPGDLFFCIKGAASDGHDYASAAADAGAAALMVTRRLDTDIPQVVVEDDRYCMALIASRFYGEPSAHMTMLGVTGTNGKTTTTYLLKSIAEAAGRKVGLMGTIVNKIGDTDIRTEFTTPEAPELQALLRRMADGGCDTVVMEVSSSSLKFDRVAGIRYDAAAFTNLTRDHMDVHGGFDDYRACKKKLFFQSGRACINIESPEAEYMARGIPCPVTYFGCGGDIAPSNIGLRPTGTSFDIDFFGRERIHVDMHIPGNFTAENALAAASLAFAAGFDAATIKRGLEAVDCVDGRFQVLTRGLPYTVILDYSHTPDSLRNALETINGFKRGRCVCVFGCGGDRDRTKRPIMGRIAGELADFSIITSDNPRTEDPTDIIDHIEEGMRETDGRYTVIENRRSAIEYAIANALPGDVILLAGKGHETYQEINHIKHPFDEKAITAEIVAGTRK